MFVGEFAVRRGRCVLCHKEVPKYVMKFETSRDEDRNITIEYELVRTEVDQAACKICWKQLANFILSSMKRPYPGSTVQNTIADMLRNGQGKTVKTDDMARALYSTKDRWAIQKVIQQIRRMKLRGWDIETDWGRGYKLIAEPESEGDLPRVNER